MKLMRFPHVKQLILMKFGPFFNKPPNSGGLSTIQHIKSFY